MKILFILLLFSSQILANESFVDGFESIEPLPFPDEFLKERSSENNKPVDYSGYLGDSSKIQRVKKGNYYINFAISYPLNKKIDEVAIDGVEYPDAEQEITNFDYIGEVETKGGVGLNTSFGYSRGFLKYELDFIYSKIVLDEFTARSVTSEAVIDNAQSYTEIGPNLTSVEDDNATVKIGSLSVNLLLNLRSKEKKLRPFIGAGYGYAIIGAGGDKETSAISNIKYGFEYKLNKKVRFFVSMTEIDFGKVEYEYEVNFPATLTTADGVVTNANLSKRIYSLEHELKEKILLLGYNFSF